MNFLQDLRIDYLEQRILQLEKDKRDILKLLEMTVEVLEMHHKVLKKEKNDDD